MNALPSPPGWNRPWLVFTDLDGTLLDHDSYSYAAARPALSRLRELGIACIFTTSKTRREVLKLRAETGNTDPFIVENGGALLLPQQHPLAQLIRKDPRQAADPEGLICQSFGPTRKDILQRLQRAGLDQDFSWRGFSSMPLDEIAARTGLPPADAEDASWREYCEPVVWLDTQDKLAQFLQALPTLGLKALKGGRFMHLLGEDVDKSRAMRTLLSACPGQPGSITLGDSDNDIGMLECADIAVLVRARHRPYPDARGREYTLPTQAPGPAGWNEAIQHVLNVLEQSQGRWPDPAPNAQQTD